MTRCRCDDCLFADLENRVSLNVGATWTIDRSNPEQEQWHSSKFSRGTIPDLESAVTRCLAEFPEHRVVQDVDRWVRTLTAIKDAKGCAIPERNTRSGRRLPAGMKTTKAGEGMGENPNDEDKEWLKLYPSVRLWVDEETRILIELEDEEVAAEQAAATVAAAALATMAATAPAQGGS